MTELERKLLWDMLDKTNPNAANNKIQAPDYYQEFADKTTLETRYIKTTNGDTQIDIIESKTRQKPSGVFINFFGGGFCNPHGERNTWFCRRIAAELDIMVVDCFYKITRDSCFPDTQYEAYDCVKWVSDHAAELQIDPGKIVVCGDSSGGMLTMGVGLMNNEKKEMDIAQLILVYAGLQMFRDPALIASPERVTRNRLYFMMYCETLELAQNPLASPILAPREMLEGLPSVLFINGDLDPTLEQEKEMARNLIDADVPVIFKTYPQSIHGFVGRWVGAYKEAIRDIEAVVRHRFESIDIKRAAK